jgi:hypothetical protein
LHGHFPVIAEIEGKLYFETITTPNLGMKLTELSVFKTGPCIVLTAQSDKNPKQASDGERYWLLGF